MSKNEDVDPAALLIAIVPFASTPLTEPGAWHWLNTILAGAVLTVLVAYTCTGARRRPRPAAERVAIGTVIGLAAAVASAYLIQSLLTGEWNPDQITDINPHIDQATLIGLLVGLVVAMVVFRLLRYDTPGTESPGTSTAVAPAPTGPASAPDEPGEPPS